MKKLLIKLAPVIISVTSFSLAFLCKIYGYDLLVGYLIGIIMGIYLYWSNK